jgi:hypothetical protein
MAAEICLFSRYLSAFKSFEHQLAGPKGKYFNLYKLLAFTSKIQV